MLKEIVVAIQAYFEAHRFILKNRLWKWILFPGLLYTVLFLTSMYFFGKSANSFIDWIQHILHLESWLQKIDSGFLSFLFAFAGLILWLILMLFYFSLFKYIWLILGSPIFAYLSEKTEAILENRDLPFNRKQLFKDIHRGIRIALRNSVWQSLYVISILLISLIPVIGWATPVLAILVECYYYGFSMLDFSFERRQISPQQSILFIGNHKGLAIGNGIVFYSMQLVPVAGWLLAPAYSVIAATLSVRMATSDLS